MASGCIPPPLVPFAPGSSILLDSPSPGAHSFPFLFPRLSYYDVPSTLGTSYLPDDLVLIARRFLPQLPPSSTFFSIRLGLELDWPGSTIACPPLHYWLRCAHPIFYTGSVTPPGFEIGFLQCPLLVVGPLHAPVASSFHCNLP